MLLKDGKELKRGNLGYDLKIPPQGIFSYSLKGLPRDLNFDSEHVLQVSLIQKETKGLLPKGHEIAWAQFVLNPVIQINSPALIQNDLVIVSNEFIEIKNDVVSLIIDPKSGEILSWIYEGKEITNKPIKPNFWRPPTDNDLGNGMPKWAKVWQEATYNNTPKLIEHPLKTAAGYSYTVGYSLPNDEAKVSARFTLLTKGSLNVSYIFEPNKRDLPLVPRLGMYMLLSNSFTDVSWYGKGPEESYWDRKTGQKIRVYSGMIKEQFHAYPRPQETGNKSDVRWMEVSSDELIIRASGKQLLNSSVWPFKMAELDFYSEEGEVSASGLVPVTKKHGADIRTGEIVQWNIDYLQMGVGGDTSWGRPVYEEYTIKPKKYTYFFSIEPTKK